MPGPGVDPARCKATPLRWDDLLCRLANHPVHVCIICPDYFGLTTEDIYSLLKTSSNQRIVSTFTLALSCIEYLLIAFGYQAKSRQHSNDKKASGLQTSASDHMVVAIGWGCPACFITGLVFVLLTGCSFYQKIDAILFQWVSVLIEVFANKLLTDHTDTMYISYFCLPSYSRRSTEKRGEPSEKRSESCFTFVAVIEAFFVWV